MRLLLGIVCGLISFIQAQKPGADEESSATGHVTPLPPRRLGSILCGCNGAFAFDATAVGAWRWRTAALFVPAERSPLTLSFSNLVETFGPPTWICALSVPDGIRSREGTCQEVESDCISPEVSGVSDESNRAECVQRKDDCSNVVNASRTQRQNRIADELTAVRTVWLRADDEKALRRALLDLLRHLEQSE